MVKVLSDIISEIALSIGIQIVGVSSVTDYGYMTDALEMRNNGGWSCEFEEKNIAKRLYAQSIMPGCLSIIAVALPYAEGYQMRNVATDGLLSVSSFGIDYHVLMREKLKLLERELGKYYSFNSLKCVDTSPLIDREVSRRAGIGSYGRNASLINAAYGSFIYLGYLLTDIVFEDCSQGCKLMADSCKDCNLCVLACPASAIKGNGIIDASRCVSYLTQTKKNIPVKYRRTMGNSIYGCDICQMVCPQNEATLSHDCGIDYSVLSVNLKELIEMDKHTFNLRFGHMSGAWRGRNVWRRNALIAIANQGITDLYLVAKAAMDDNSPMIRQYAAWTAACLGGGRAKDEIRKRMLRESGDTLSEMRLIIEDEIYDNGNM